MPAAEVAVTMDVKIYQFDPLGVINNTIGGFTTYSGPAVPQGTATITDNATGTNGLFLDDVANETATATTTLNGVTDTTPRQVYAEEVWTLVDQVTGQTFQLVTFRVNAGPNTGYYTLSEVPLVPGRSYQTTGYDTVPNASAGDAAFSYADYVESDGIVEGTGGDDVIDDTYTGDPGNDMVDSSFVSPTPLDFNWSAYADEQDLRAGVTQNTGGIQVDVSYSDVQTNEQFSAERSGGADAIYSAPGENFATNSAAYLFANGSADDSIVTFDFSANTGSGFENSVENVRFRISDIDGLNDGTNNFRDVVTIRAYDENGNEVPVTITGGSNHTVSGNTITAGLTNYTPASVEASALIQIAGPVSQIVITYDNGGTTQQAVYISDIKFDAVPLGSNDDTVQAGGGNDFVDSGAGDDSVSGGTGNDTIYGGQGADTLSGDSGNDTIYAGVGDTATGGDGDDTFLIDTSQLGGGTITITGGEGAETVGDTLDFNGQLQVGSVVITNADDDAGGKSGTATLLDGTTVTFSEIESIICFANGTAIETPYGPRPVESLMPGDLVLTRDHGPQPSSMEGRTDGGRAGRLCPD
ncbi:Hint domain-containing protein [Marimonas sp. MJW-29]|uniref:Hint domain-containing protein n=2 Tax=Sulfitobacter sediminis TaxID=3234186 RepID=A0ABV3RHC6_9RHOB